MASSGTGRDETETNATGVSQAGRAAGSELSRAVVSNYLTRADRWLTTSFDFTFTPGSASLVKIVRGRELERQCTLTTFRPNVKAYVLPTLTDDRQRCSSFDASIRWRGGATDKAFGLAISRSRVQILLEATLRNNLRQVVYT